MNEILLRIFPVIAIFALGAVLRAFKICSRHDGDMLLKLVFYIGIPGLVLPLFATVVITPKLAGLIFFAPVIVLLTYVVSSFFGSRMIADRKRLGTFVIGSITINTLFVLPFVIAAYGNEGFTDAMMIDFGNGISIFSFNYWIACRYGEERGSASKIVLKFITSPPLWAIAIGLLLNLLGIPLHPVAGEFCKRLGDLTVPMTMIALGIYFTPKLIAPRAIFWASLIRMGIGACAGFTLSRLFGFDPMGQRVATLVGAAPAGFNTLTYSSICKLDSEFAASLVSVSLMTGIVGLPCLILFLNYAI